MQGETPLVLIFHAIFSFLAPLCENGLGGPGFQLDFRKTLRMGISLARFVLIAASGLLLRLSPYCGGGAIVESRGLP